MILVNTLSYIDRNTLALLAPAILRDTHLNSEQYGFIISGFSVAWMLGQSCEQVHPLLFVSIGWSRRKVLQVHPLLFVSIGWSRRKVP
jgi:hypothetical protein